MNGHPEAYQKVLQLKAHALASGVANGKPPDDVKWASGTIYGLKTLLGLRQCGNNAEEFCIEALAPLVTADTEIYNRLKKHVFEGHTQSSAPSSATAATWVKSPAIMCVLWKIMPRPSIGLARLDYHPFDFVGRILNFSL